MTENPISPKHKFKWPDKKELFLLVSALVLSLGIPEICARIFWTPSPPQLVVGTRKFTEVLSQLSLGAESGKKLYIENNDRLWSLDPGKVFDSYNPHYFPNVGDKQPIRITINQEGYRGSRVNQQATSSTLRVLCLGDSNYFGYPLDDNDTFPSVLSKALAHETAPSKVEVINAGVPGYSVVQGTIWYENKFQHYDFDWMLLSYLNNDAWPHPQTDEKLLAKYQKMPNWLLRLGKSLHIVQWANSFLTQEMSQGELKPRVPLDVFTEKYRFLIQSARSKGARVMILDYRADYEGYGNYEPYSIALNSLAKEMKVHYFPVNDRAKVAIEDWKSLELQYDLKRVKRRWGMLLEKMPHLYLYAEYYPEHLNEAGTAWLADQVSPVILSNK